MSYHKLMLLLAALLLASAPLRGDTPNTRIRYEDQRLRVSMTARTPLQMAGFYEARGFPDAMIDTIRQYCFITTYIKNKSERVLWMDLGQWQFFHDGKPLKRLDRDHWKATWMKMGAPMASQSTFRWTLIPERLDYRPNEAEGGNIVLPRVEGPIQVRARFSRQKDFASGQVISVDLPPIHCAEDP